MYYASHEFAVKVSVVQRDWQKEVVGLNLIIDSLIFYTHQWFTLVEYAKDILICPFKLDCKAFLACGLMMSACQHFG